jgi:hypothetical protein
METRERLRQQWDEMHGRAWIPVSERLPNAGSDDVLVAFDCGDGSHSQSIGWHNGTQWMFYTSSDVRSQWPVTHWMPLPHPPAT